ncbi:DNA (cytosine-5-)-methyltransferase [Methylobacterium radiotolerans]|nr:DNA (cytosine-5-)-methyltransferase [Methylobacterium radiotolerans]
MPTLLDLFSGCGGLTLGAKLAGYTTALAVDIDPILSSSFEHNFPGVPLINFDVRELDAARLKTLLPSGVDGVVGGPPCQGFSGIGRQHVDDPRRDLLEEFFRIVDIVAPSFFLMENVPGLGFPKNIGMLHRALKRLRAGWTILGPIVLDASDFGAATRRKRIFVFGFDPKKMDIPTLADITKTGKKPANVHDAISDLANIPVSMEERWTYDAKAPVSTYARALRSATGTFTGHQLTIHKPHTIKRFARVRPGAIDPVGKHKRLEWNGLCPTIRAGTGSDRGSYQAVRPIHPELNRVITPREAARLQGFPDDHIFHPTVWHSFRMIGNSVSPIIANELLHNIKKFLFRATSSY